MENEKTIIAPVVTVDELNHDYRTLIIHSHINFMGKMVLNENGSLFFQIMVREMNDLSHQKNKI